MEQIEHQTQARPFGIYRTVVDGDNTNALYVHCHPEAEFFYLEEGEMTFYAEERAYPLRAGEGMFLPPNLVHHGVKEPGRGCAYSAVVFSLNWLTGHLGGESGLYTNILLQSRYECICKLTQWDEDGSSILPIIRHFKEYMDRPIHTYEMKLLGELLVCFQELYNARFAVIPYKKPENTLQKGVRESIDYINLHFGEPLTLEAIAKCSGYSVSHLSHSFKAYTGYSLFAYINRLRVIKAAEALAVSNARIIDIASECGFENISYFNRVFRKQMGVSPGTYRMQTAYVTKEKIREEERA